jgi:hypothetical protein
MTMLTHLISASILLLGAVVAPNSVAKQAASDCCTAKLTCCAEGAACCQAQQPKCCAQGETCCAENRDCCHAAK